MLSNKMILSANTQCLVRCQNCLLTPHYYWTALDCSRVLMMKSPEDLLSDIINCLAAWLVLIDHFLSILWTTYYALLAVHGRYKGGVH